MNKLKRSPETPYTQDQIMQAMTELHKLILKQSEAYGGPRHKFIPAEVVETQQSLLQQFENGEDEDLFEDSRELDRLLYQCEHKANLLQSYLKDKDEKRGAGMVYDLLKFIGLAIAEARKSPAK